MAGDGWFGRHKWRPYNDAGQVLSSGAFMRICGKVAQYRSVRIHAHRREDENVFLDKRHCAINCAATIRAVISGITWKGYLREKSRHHDLLRMRFLHYPAAQTVAARFIAHFNYRTAAESAINCPATTRAVISGITWKGYMREKSHHYDLLRMRFLHCPVAQTVAARFIAHFNYRTTPSRRLQIMHYRLVQHIQLLFQQEKPFTDDLLIFSALAGALDLSAQIIDLAGVNDLRRSAQPVQR
jgi:hypothetical protein